MLYVMNERIFRYFEIHIFHENFFTTPRTTTWWLHCCCHAFIPPPPPSIHASWLDFCQKISMMNKRPPYQMGLEKSQSNLSSRNKPLIKHKSLVPPFRVHAIFRAFVTTIQWNSLYKWELRNCLFDCGWRDFEKCLMAPQNFPLALFRSINLCENLSRQPTTRFLHGDAGMVPIMFYASYMPPQPPPG